jgi:signal transduction histidine kinase/ActR/RegA family two-component response regulator
MTSRIDGSKVRHRRNTTAFRHRGREDGEVRSFLQDPPMAERRLTPLPDDQRGSRRWTPPTLAASPAVLRAPFRSTVTVVLIGLTAAALIYSLQLVVARNQRVQVHLAEMEGYVNLLNAREWEARTGVISMEHKNDIPVSQENLRNILSDLRQWTGQPGPVPGSQRSTNGPPPTGLQQVEIDVSRYLTAVDEMFSLIDRQRSEALVVADTVDQAFEDLRISLQAARSYYATAGKRAINRANLASLVSVLFAMGLVWLLLGRAARQRTETQALTTERRTLAASEARWRALILNGEDAILVVSPTGAISYASPNVDRVLSVPSGGLGDSVLSALPPDVRPAMLVLLEATQREPGRPRVQELQLSGAPGTPPRFLEVVATNLLADSALGGIVLNLRDLTERRAMEEALRESQEQLLHAQKMEALGRLAGGIAHDFNNLMMAISGYTELVLQDQRLSPTSREDVAQIRRAVFRAAELTQQILAYSRRQMLQPVPVSLNLLLGEASGMLRRLMPENIELKLALDPKAPDVLVDPGHMLQVVMNLAVNARDAMPNGGALGIRTTATDGAPESSNGTGRRVQLVVNDTGTGIDPKVLPLIFDPFFTTKPQGEGSGLGLSTVFGIVKQSGGQIDVQSELNRGTTFTISLPAAPAVVPRDEGMDAQSPARSGGEVILVVEDDDQVRTVVSKGLPRLGYEVLVVRNAEEALALVEKHPGRIDLLLTDVVMPGLSGPQLADRLTAHRPETRVVFMSGYPEAQDPALGFSLDGRSYLQKPFALAELAEKIRTALDE